MRFSFAAKPGSQSFVPQLVQNLLPAGMDLPQLGQTCSAGASAAGAGAASRAAPQLMQNLLPSGTAWPQAGQVFPGAAAGASVGAEAVSGAGAAAGENRHVV